MSYFGWTIFSPLGPPRWLWIGKPRFAVVDPYRIDCSLGLNLCFFATFGHHHRRHRVVWGLTTGEVALSTFHAGSDNTLRTFRGFHTGAVSSVKLVQDHDNFVLSGGLDGVVRLWRVSQGRCICKFRKKTDKTGYVPTINQICCEPESYIVAGTSNGEIYVWKVNVEGIITRKEPLEDEFSDGDESMPGMAPTDFTPSRFPRIIKLPEEFSGVGYLEVDFGMYGSGLILAQATDANVVHVYSLETLAHLATLKSPMHGTPISAVYWGIPKYEKSIFSTSDGWRTSKTHGLHKRPGGSSVIATGDHSGNVCLWYLSDNMRRRLAEENERDLHPSQVTREAKILEPSFSLRAHDAKVTSLFVDALVIVSGR